MTFSLHKDLASSGWHSSIATTYSVDPAFYDMYVQRRLRMHGVKNNILMADARMFKKALDALPEAFSAAGDRYAVVPVSVVGAFHPKVHLRIGENKARLVIGSANVTAAGWGKNQEVVTRLDWSWRKKDVPDNAAMGHLVAKAYAYLERWLSEVPGAAIRYKLQMLERQAQWLPELEQLERPVTFSDETAADLICESGGDSPSMLRQFADLATQEKVRRLIVVSPYWDANLRGFLDLRSAFGDPTTIVALNPRINAFPVNALARNDRLKFVAIGEAKSMRFLHAKIFIAQTANADHVLFGSANCSDDAIGHLRGKSRNAEVSVYRRLPPRKILETLGIDTSMEVSRKDILPPVPISKSAVPIVAPVPAGVIELRGQTLTWWPPVTVSAQSASIEIGEISITPYEEAGGKWVAKFTAKLTSPIIAWIRYSDGKISDPVIVHVETALRKASPGCLDPRLSDALDKARGPDGDLLDLAALAHVIFEPAPRRVTTKSSGGGGKGKSNSIEHAVVDYANGKEFRNAMKMLPGTGKTGRMDDDAPGLQDLLGIINRGIANSLPQAEHDPDELDVAILDGDVEDEGDELPEDEPADDANEPQPSPKSAPSSMVRDKAGQFFTEKEILGRRKKLVKALDLFDVMLTGLNADPSRITSRLAVQTMFVFRLMRYGVAYAHNISESGSQRLMVLSEGSLGAERFYSFAYRAANVLRRIWLGERSIASQIRLDLRQTELPDDIYGFIVVSRWALARAYLEAKRTDPIGPVWKPSLLTAGLSKMGREIYAATAAFGQVDPAAELQTVSEWDLEIGCTAMQTAELIQCLHNFGTPVPTVHAV